MDFSGISEFLEYIGYWFDKVITMIAHLVDFKDNMDTNYAGPTED